MNAELIIFIVLAAMAVAGAISLIVQRHPIHSALSLIVVMASLAGLYLLLEAEFVAAVQVIVYAGAIMVLFVFVIMLLNTGLEERTNFSHMARYAGLPLGAALLVVLTFHAARASAAMEAAAPVEQATRSVSLLLFRDFAFPFEFTSILILVALVGAMVLAKRDTQQGG
jgi:NADH-quinone oxidoreductase subunit J